MGLALLLAEDDLELREIYERFLRRHGYDVETSPDGLDCIAKLRRRRPAVLVLGLDLLWGGSAGVLAWLREQRGAPMPPVVLVGDGGTPAFLTDSTHPPIVGCLRKPFSLTELLASVRSAEARGPRAAGVSGSREKALHGAHC
jgi:DNA-binding response OmpR family regulator